MWEHLRSCITSLQNFFVLQNWNSVNINADFPFPLPSRPWQPHAAFCLSDFDWLSHTSGIRQYLSFSDRFISLSIMSSGCIHVAACIWISFLFKVKYYSSVCIHHIFLLPIHLLMDIWVASTFWLLWIMLPWTELHKYLFEFVLSVHLVLYLEWITL